MCDTLKGNIKANRAKYRKQEKEFEGVLDDDKPQVADQQEVIALDENSHNQS